MPSTLGRVKASGGIAEVALCTAVPGMYVCMYEDLTIEQNTLTDSSRADRIFCVALV